MYLLFPKINNQLLGFVDIEQQVVPCTPPCNFLLVEYMRRRKISEYCLADKPNIYSNATFEFECYVSVEGGVEKVGKERKTTVELIINK